MNGTKIQSLDRPNQDSDYLVDSVILTSIWFSMVIIVHPLGDFPINDDWAFAQPVKIFVEENRLTMTDWASMNLIAQTIWGGLVCKIFGFSYDVLRFSTFFLGLVGILATYQTIRVLNGSRQLAMLGALGMAVNPIYFASSITFMTDIPFFAFLSLSLLYYLKALQSSSDFEILLGTLAAGVAILIRQPGFTLPIAFAVSYCYVYGLNIKSLFRCLSPLAFCGIVQALFHKWMVTSNQLSALYGLQIREIKETLEQGYIVFLSLYASNLVSAVLYISYFTLPVLLVVSSMVTISPKDKNRLLYWIIGVSALWFFGRNHGLEEMPRLHNIVNDIGIGPLLQHGSIIFRRNNVTPLVALFWSLVELLSILSLGLFGYITTSNSKFSDSKTKRYSKGQYLFIWIALGVYLAPVLSIARMFDRYLLFPFLLGILIICTGQSYTRISYRYVYPVLLLVISAVLTVGAVHDHFAWNKVRWHALRELVKQGVSPDLIDGGMEFNATYHYTKEKQKPDFGGLWWVIKDDYLLAFSDNYSSEGYKPYKEYSVNSWLGVSPNKIYILKK